jgi:AraC-like DNA-binding protein
MTQWTPKALLTHLQMLAAVELLREAECCKEVAARLGYKDRASFSRRFKSCFGLTPWAFAHHQDYHKKPETAGKAS